MLMKLMTSWFEVPDVVRTGVLSVPSQCCSPRLPKRRIGWLLLIRTPLLTGADTTRPPPSMTLGFGFALVDRRRRREIFAINFVRC